MGSHPQAEGELRRVQRVQGRLPFRVNGAQPQVHPPGTCPTQGWRSTTCQEKGGRSTRRARPTASNQHDNVVRGPQTTPEEAEGSNKAPPPNHGETSGRQRGLEAQPSRGPDSQVQAETRKPRLLRLLTGGSPTLEAPRPQNTPRKQTQVHAPPPEKQTRTGPTTSGPPDPRVQLPYQRKHPHHPRIPTPPAACQSRGHDPQSQEPPPPC